MRHRNYRAGVLTAITGLLTAAMTLGLTLTASTARAGPVAADLPAPTQTAAVSGNGSGGQATLTGVRVGRHDRYDRTVFDFTGGTPTFRAAYGKLYHQARDLVIPLAGEASLVIVFEGVDTGAVDLDRVLNPGFPVLRQVKSGGALEGYASFGLGLADRVGFRVFTLHRPERVVVDVAHQPTQPFQTTAFGYDGTAAEALVERVRAGRHPGYDRLVFDMAGTDLPVLRATYAGSTSTIQMTFTGRGSAVLSPHASFAGPQTVRFGLPELRSVSFTVVGAGLMTATVTTQARHGFRVLLLHQPTRVVLDVRH
jgi:hypothetical protein